MGCFDFSPYAFPPGSRMPSRGPFGSARDNADYARALRRSIGQPITSEDVGDATARPDLDKAAPTLDGGE